MVRNIEQKIIWLRRHGSLFFNDVVDCTRKNNKYYECTWIPGNINVQASWSEGDSHDEAADVIYYKIKKELYRRCGGP